MAKCFPQQRRQVSVDSDKRSCRSHCLYSDRLSVTRLLKRERCKPVAFGRVARRGIVRWQTIDALCRGSLPRTVDVSCEQVPGFVVDEPVPIASEHQVAIGAALD